MFCDLVGSTALSAKLDPEDLRGIIAAYHGCCAELVERNGGFVAKYINGIQSVQNRIFFSFVWRDYAHDPVSPRLGLGCRIG
jgi:hypothetical protein